MGREIRKAANWGGLLLFNASKDGGKGWGLGLCYSPANRNMDIKQDELI